MAVSIPSGAGNRLASANGTATNFGSAGSIFLKINPNWNSGDGGDHTFYNRGNNTDLDIFRMEKFSDNQVYMGFYDDGTEGRVIVADIGLFSSGVWANHIVTWNLATPLVTYYVNNVSKGTNGVATLPDWAASGIDREEFGNAGLAGSYSSTTVADASLAEFARWDRVLDATERAILQAGFSPLFIPRGLVAYRPLINGSASRLGLTEGPDVTVNASGTSWVTHPAVLYPASPLGRWLHTAAAATSTAGFRSFNAFLFLPNAGAGGAVVTPPTVTSGRKLISPAMAKTLTAELT